MASNPNEGNYQQRAIKAQALPRAEGLLKSLSGEMTVRRPTIVETSNASAPTPTARDPRDTDYNILPQSNDTSFFNYFDHFLSKWGSWQMNNDKRCR